MDQTANLKQAPQYPTTHSPAAPCNKHQLSSPPHKSLCWHHQSTINLQHNNQHWGDELLTTPHLLCIASKNINSLSTNDNFIQWCSVVQAMSSHNISALSLQEPNTHWTNHLHKHVQHILQQTFCQSALTTLNSTKPSHKTFQPGGMATTIVGAYASHLLSSGQDPSGMGRWSFIELLGKLNKHLIIA